jgi:hypothetical protein
MYALFSVAYTWKYNEFAETHLDLIAFNEKYIVPSYVKEFIYELGREKEPQEVQTPDA